MDDLESAQRYKALCDQWMAALTKATGEPLTFEARDSQGLPVTKRAHNVVDHYVVKTGTLWIGLTCPPRRVVKPKHTCPACGAKHTVKGGI